jgi:hypothetical protein
MHPILTRLAAVVTTALLLPMNVGAIESENPELMSYMGIPFHNTTLQALTERLGESALFDPPGEVLLPDEVCYQAEGDLNATFFVEHYGRSRKTSTVIGMFLSRNKSNDEASAPTCAVPKVALSDCVGKLCLGDSIEQVKQLLPKEMTYSNSYEWTYDVRLSPADLVVASYRDAMKGNEVPDWMYPTHTVRVQLSEGRVTGIYVAIDVDMA